MLYEVITHILVEPDPLAENLVRSNPPERCYYCKKIIIAAINQALLNENVDAIVITSYSIHYTKLYERLQARKRNIRCS